MRFVHLADLHIGKRLHDLSLLPDQAAALDAILAEIGRIRPDAALIAGDVYDKAVPSEEAVRLFDRFVSALSALGVTVCAIGGNHDSDERLSFAKSVLARQRLHIAGRYEGRIEKVTLEDAFGEVDVWLLPHMLPREAARFFDEPVETAEDAVRLAIARENIDPARRGVLVAHQFFRAAGESQVLSDSEINPVGGLDAVDAALLKPFRYAALGHLHGPQRVGRDTARYAGSPLKYSFSEINHVKSFVSGEIDADGGVSFSLVPVPQPHGMRALTGALDSLLSEEALARGDVNDYLRVTLTDTPIPLSPRDRLDRAYPNVLRLDFASDGCPDAPPAAAERGDRLSLFEAFYTMRTGRQMPDSIRDAVSDAMQKVFGEVNA